jgi:hypothetical protein
MPNGGGLPFLGLLLGLGHLVMQVAASFTANR